MQFYLFSLFPQYISIEITQVYLGQEISIMKNIELYNLIQSVITHEKNNQFLIKQKYTAKQTVTQPKDQQSGVEEINHIKLAETIYKEYMRNSKLKDYSKVQKLGGKSKRVRQIWKGFKTLESFIEFPMLMSNIDKRIKQELINTRRHNYVMNSTVHKQFRERQESKKYLQDIKSYQYLPQQRQAKKLLKTVYKKLQQKNKQQLDIEAQMSSQIINQLQRNSIEINKHKVSNNYDTIYTEALRNEKSELLRVDIGSEYKREKYFEKINDKEQDDDDFMSDEMSVDYIEADQCLSNTKNRSKFWKLLQDRDKMNAYLREQALLQAKRNKKKEEIQITSSIQYASLMHRASSYLQIILEREHLKKWKLNHEKMKSLPHKNGTKTARLEQPSQREVSTLVKTLRKQMNPGPEFSQSSKKAIKSIHKITDRSSFSKENKPAEYQFKFTERQMKQTHHTARKNKNEKNYRLSMPLLKKKITTDNFNKSKEIFMKSSTLHRPYSKNQVKEGFNFRKRKIKQKCLNKINFFNDNVEFLQKQIIKENKEIEGEIEKIQEGIDIDYNLMSTQIKPHEYLQICPKTLYELSANQQYKKNTSN